MAGKLKLSKYPKKPKANASVSTLENYISKCKEVDKKNAEVRKMNSKRDSLKKTVAKIGKAK
ncbi:MAG: hypothetical protein WCL70_07960 [Paludibacter sp.]